MTIDNIIDALAAFIGSFVAEAEIVRGQADRVPMPKGPCIVLTELLSVDLETPNITGDRDAGTATINARRRFDVQVDFYGPSSGDWAACVQAVYRSMYAPAMFPEGVAPLYCSDAVQMPFISGEQQYESRWTLTASLQYNTGVTVPTQYSEQVMPVLYPA